MNRFIKLSEQHHPLHRPKKMQVSDTAMVSGKQQQPTAAGHGNLVRGVVLPSTLHRKKKPLTKLSAGNSAYEPVVIVDTPASQSIIFLVSATIGIPGHFCGDHRRR
jgi:hypothetical protein